MSAAAFADIVVASRDAIDEGVYLEALRAAGVPADHLSRPEAAGFESGKSGFEAFEARSRDTTTAKVVVKRSPAGSNLLARREVAFYRKIAPRLTAPVLARCYGVIYAEAEGAYHLLLEDLRGSHKKLASDFVSRPGEVALKSMIRALAPVHAAWWQHPELEELDPPKGPDELGAFYDHYATELARRARPLMNEERLSLFTRAHAALSELLRRDSSRLVRQSLIHADAHLGNVLMPLDGARDSARVIDWERWMTGSPARDLAYVLCFGYSPDTKRALRLRAQHHQFEMLGEAGITNYAWREYLDDYHRSVLTCLPNLVWLLEAPTLEEFWDQLLVNYADEVELSLRALRW